MMSVSMIVAIVAVTTSVRYGIRALVAVVSAMIEKNVFEIFQVAVGNTSQRTIVALHSWNSGATTSPPPFQVFFVFFLAFFSRLDQKYARIRLQHDHGVRGCLCSSPSTPFWRQILCTTSAAQTEV
mmetsp:Transcript_55002/g.80730  ORF Transcript_55002/g.80730 Transcript_55002/m.80730 type:complete len:126 (+) Transcript_55002:310-687(+)